MCLFTLGRREKGREMTSVRDCILVLHVCNHDCAGSETKMRSWNSFQVSHVSGRNPITLTFTIASQSTHYKEESGAGVGIKLNYSKTRCGCRGPRGNNQAKGPNQYSFYIHLFIVWGLMGGEKFSLLLKRYVKELHI